MTRIITFVFLLLVQILCISFAEKSTCHCEQREEFQRLCDRISAYREDAKRFVGFFACYCLCPLRNVEVIYPHVAPMRSDLYHHDQLKFLNDVVRHSNFKQSMVVYGSTADQGTMDMKLRKYMFDKIGQPFLSHAHDLSAGGKPTHLFFIPDHLFIRNGGYTNLVNKLRSVGLSMDQRAQKCFWRGSATAEVYGAVDIPRYRMCMTAKNMSWIDAGISKTFNGAQQSVYSSQGVMKGYAGEEAWIQNRCILDIDGSVNAWGLTWRLASGSVVFKFDSNWTNNIILAMKPFEHYIPLSADFSDFKTRTGYATDDQFIPFMRRITDNAFALYESFSYDNEVNRVANELQAYIEKYNEADTSQLKSQGFKAQVAWANKQVNRLLQRLSPVPRKVRNQDKPIRYEEEDYAAAFPDFLMDMFTNHSDSCFPMKADELCPILTNIPRLATYTSPDVFLNKSTENVLNFTNAATYYRPGNVEYIKTNLVDAYNKDERCNYDNYYESPMYKKRLQTRSAATVTGHDPHNINPDCPNSRHMIFTMAENYICNKYSLYLKTLRDSGVCADVYIVVNDENNRPCHNIESSCGTVTLLPIGGKYRDFSMDIIRFLVPLEFLNEYIYNKTLAPTATPADTASLLCTQVLITDFGDVYFQGNPFTSFMYKVDAEVVFTEESYNEQGGYTTIFDEMTKSNYAWLRAVSLQIFGEDANSKLGGMPAINCGLGIGTLGGMYKYLWVMAYIAELMDEKQARPEPNTYLTMQGNLNFAFYGGWLNKVLRVRVLSPSTSVFINGVYHHPSIQTPGKPYDFHANPMVNDLQIPYAVVHMYNRFHMMLICEEFLLTYAKIDWKFKAVGPAQECAPRNTSSPAKQIAVTRGRLRKNL